MIRSLKILWGLHSIDQCGEQIFIESTTWDQIKMR